MKMLKCFSIALSTFLLISCGSGNVKQTPKISHSKPYYVENSHVVLTVANKRLLFKKEHAIEKKFTEFFRNSLASKLRQKKLIVGQASQSPVRLRVKVHYSMVYFALTNRKANPVVGYSIYVKKDGRVIDQHHSGEFTVTRGIFRKKSQAYEFGILNQLADKIVNRVESL